MIRLAIALGSPIFSAGLGYYLQSQGFNVPALFWLMGALSMVPFAIIVGKG